MLLSDEPTSRSEPPPADLTGLVILTITKPGARWGSNLIGELTHQAGFTSGTYGGRGIRDVLPGRFKAEPICFLQYETMPAQIGEGVEQFSFVLDPAVCCRYYGAFLTMWVAACHVAGALGADVVDLAGEPVSNATADSIEMKLRLLQDARSTGIREELAGGMYRERGDLSCISRVYRRSGSLVESNHFDVPEEPYLLGKARGLRLAREYVEFAASLTNPSEAASELTQILLSAGRATAPKTRHIGHRSRAWAAEEFTHEIGRLLSGALPMLSRAYAQRIEARAEALQREGEEIRAQQVQQLRRGREKAARRRALDARKAPGRDLGAVKAFKASQRPVAAARKAVTA
jgi:hypothetical protein